MMRRVHELDPLHRHCLGCGKAARDIAEGENPRTECPAFYRAIEGRLVIITPREQLLIVRAGVVVSFGQLAMFEIRDAINEGVRELREGHRSEVSPL